MPASRSSRNVRTCARAGAEYEWGVHAVAAPHMHSSATPNRSAHDAPRCIAYMHYSAIPRMPDRFALVCTKTTLCTGTATR